MRWKNKNNAIILHLCIDMIYNMIYNKCRTNERTAKAEKVEHMKASYIFNNYYNQMTAKARKVVEQSDQTFDDFAGEFDSVQAFNDFCEENYSDDDLN